jgi:heme/copper-type cytochrome/quinol oxidase subunit 2
VANRLNDWHAIVMVLCLVIIAAVFGALLYSILARRRSEEAASGNFHKRTAVEVIWAVLPFVIVIGMALPTARTVMDGPAPLAAGEHAVAATPERSVQCTTTIASNASARPGCP